MVYYIQEGDIFRISQVCNFAHGCNCAGVMGKGIALQFKKRFPQMYEQYKDLCRSGKFLVGDVFAYSYPEGVIYNLGTQRTWKEKAEMNYISTSLHKMMEMAEDYGIKEIAMPAIGAGLGGEDWSKIKKMISDVAKNHPYLDLYVVQRYKDVETKINYIKKLWKEGRIIFYFQFIGGDAVRQVEVENDKTIRLSVEHPVCGDYFLCDQDLSQLDFSSEDYITKKEFEKVWEKG